MDHIAYRDRFIEYWVDLWKVAVHAHLSDYIFGDFPTYLSHDAQCYIANTMIAVEHNLEIPDFDPYDFSDEKEAQDHEPDRGFVEALTAMATFTKGTEPEGYDFRSQTLSQALVMMVAYTESFINDSLRRICYADSSVMRKGNPRIAFNDLEAYGSWDELVADLSEVYARNFGSTSVADRLHRVNDTFKLKFDYTDETKARLAKAIQIRNCIIHNGGRADRKYAERWGEESVFAGDRIVIEESDIVQLARDLTSASYKLWMAVLTKYQEKE